MTDKYSRPGRVVVLENYPADSRIRISEDGTVQTLASWMGTGGNNTPMVMALGNGQTNQPVGDEIGALNCMHDQMAVMVSAVDCRNATENPDENGTLQTKPNGGTSYNTNNVVRTGSTIRRITPLEAERLQGFPDGWTDVGVWTDEKGKKHKTADSARYRALGNSLALPFWHWLLKRISEHCGEKTMGSLFDGIGGFPLCWQSVNGDGSCLWSSEIEPFCVALTKKRFGDAETGEKGDWKSFVKTERGGSH